MATLAAGRDADPTALWEQADAALYEGKHRGEPPSIADPARPDDRGGADGIDDRGQEGIELAASRELEEETGYRADKVDVVGRFASSPGMVSETFCLVRATGLTKVGEGGGVPGENVHHPAGYVGRGQHLRQGDGWKGPALAGEHERAEQDLYAARLTGPLAWVLGAEGEEPFRDFRSLIECSLWNEPVSCKTSSVKQLTLQDQQMWSIELDLQNATSGSAQPTKLVAHERFTGVGVEVAAEVSELAATQTDVAFIDSSGLQVLIAGLKRLRAQGGDLGLRSPTPSARRSSPSWPTDTEWIWCSTGMRTEGSNVAARPAGSPSCPGGPSVTRTGRSRSCPPKRSRPSSTLPLKAVIQPSTPSA